MPQTKKNKMCCNQPTSIRSRLIVLNQSFGDKIRTVRAKILELFEQTVEWIHWELPIEIYVET